MEWCCKESDQGNSAFIAQRMNFGMEMNGWKQTIHNPSSVDVLFGKDLPWYHLHLQIESLLHGLAHKVIMIEFHLLPTYFS